MTFKEAPQLARAGEGRQAAAGWPRARNRRRTALVIKPLQEIGKYGGTWRAGFTGPADFWNGFRCCSGPDHLMFWDYTGDKVCPTSPRASRCRTAARVARCTCAAA
jgi:peptide/nickel transport system substrate-binding protein